MEVSLPIPDILSQYNAASIQCRLNTLPPQYTAASIQCRLNTMPAAAKKPAAALGSRAATLGSQAARPGKVEFLRIDEKR